MKNAIKVMLLDDFHTLEYLNHKYFLKVNRSTTLIQKYLKSVKGIYEVLESPRAHQHQTIMKKIFLVIALCLGAFIVQAATVYGTVTVSKVISVYDGDTFRVNIDSLPPLVGKNIPIRLKGVDTPEIQGKCQYERDLALKARDFVRSKLANAKEIRLQELQRGKYFRIVADVIVDGMSLEKELLENELAYKYSGGKKSSWCN